MNEQITARWMEGFVKVAEAAGLTHPNQVEALLKVAGRLQIQLQYPEAFQAGVDEVMQKRGAPVPVAITNPILQQLVSKLAPRAARAGMPPRMSTAGLMPGAAGNAAPAVQATAPAAAAQAASHVPAVVAGGTPAAAGAVSSRQGLGALQGAGLAALLGLGGMGGIAGHKGYEGFRRNVMEEEQAKDFGRFSNTLARMKGQAEQLRSLGIGGMSGGGYGPAYLYPPNQARMW